MIETLAAHRSDQSLREWVLPRRPLCSDHFLNVHSTNSRAYHVAVSTIAISHQEPWHLIVRERFDQLLRRPLSGRIGGDIEVDDATPRESKNVVAAAYMALVHLLPPLEQIEAARVVAAARPARAAPPCATHPDGRPLTMPARRP